MQPAPEHENTTNLKKTRH